MCSGFDALPACNFDLATRATTPRQRTIMLTPLIYVLVGSQMMLVRDGKDGFRLGGVRVCGVVCVCRVGRVCVPAPRCGKIAAFRCGYSL